MKVSEGSGRGFDVESGIYEAVCFGLIDIGTQHGEYGGKPKIQHQAIMKFELIAESYEDDAGDKHRAQFSQFYTLSLHEKAKLRKHLKGWRGREFTQEELNEFELKNVLGKNCMLVIGQSEGGKSVIESISKFKGDPIKAERDLEYFSFEDFTGEFPAFISEGIQHLCVQSEEYVAYAKPMIDDAAAGDPSDLDEYEDNIPF